MKARLEWERLARGLMRHGVTVELYGTGRSYLLSVCTNDAGYFFNELAVALAAAEKAEDTTRELVVTALWAGGKRTLATFRLARQRIAPAGHLELVWVGGEVLMQ